MSYDVITPLIAARIFEAVYASPATRWIIDRIEVLNPIRSEWVTNAKHPGGPARRIRFLTDVSYIVTANLALTEMAWVNEAAAHAEKFRRAAERGPTTRTPHLGLADYPADFALVEDSSSLAAGRHADLRGDVDLGWLLFDHNGANGRSRFFEAHLCDGVLDVPAPDSAAFAM